jgi:hypothetical protein
LSHPFINWYWFPCDSFSIHPAYHIPLDILFGRASLGSLFCTIIAQDTNSSLEMLMGKETPTYDHRPAKAYDNLGSLNEASNLARTCDLWW